MVIKLWCGDPTPMSKHPQPWRVLEVPGGYVVCDANGSRLCYLYGRESTGDSTGAGGVTGLTMDDAKSLANAIALLPTLASDIAASDPLREQG